MAGRFKGRTATAAGLIALALAAAGTARAADEVPKQQEKREPAPVVQAAPDGDTRGAEHAATLDGIWTFDATRSDDPRKVMEANRPQGRGGMGGRGGAGGGWGGGRGGMRRGGGPPGDGGPPGEGEEAQRRAPGASPMERVMRPPQKLVIDLEANQVSVSEDEHAPRAYALADSLAAHERDLVTEDTSARWKGGRLEMTQALGPRGKLVETYELSRDGRTLTIRAHREGGPEGMPRPTITRVYTRYEGD